MKMLSTTWLILGFLVILILVFGLGCRAFFSKSQLPKVDKIAGQTVIDSKWKEIKFSKPLIVNSKIQIVELKLNNIKGWSDEKKEKLLLTNDEPLEIEIELFDDSGNKVKLYPNGVGKIISFGKRSEDKENFETGYFNIGDKFIKIRLRSNVKITIDEITWSEFEF